MLINKMEGKLEKEKLFFRKPLGLQITSKQSLGILPAQLTNFNSQKASEVSTMEPQ
jgi:hypothetical protein